MMRRTIIIGIVALTALSAEAREYRLSLGAGGTRVFDEGLLATTDSGWISGADFGFMAEVGSDILLGVRIRGMTGRESGADLSQSVFTADIGTFEMLATSRWNINLIKWLRPFVEIEVGAAYAEVEFTKAGLSDDGWTAVVSGFAGVELRIPPGKLLGKRFSLGLDLGGGYGWRSPLELGAQGTSLGTLDLHGALFRIALTAMW